MPLTTENQHWQRRILLAPWKVAKIYTLVYTQEEPSERQKIKKILTAMVKTVLFCASNNIPLRGHSADKGNFVKLLQFRMDARNEALKKHFAQMAGNAKYTSPAIQNEILGIASTMVVEELVAEANESFISVVTDEFCDISGKEQLSIVLRYIRGDKVNESFTRFVEVSAESISAAILAHLSRIGVDLRKLAGQSYDGASTMAGHMSGV